MFKSNLLRKYYEFRGKYGEKLAERYAKFTVHYGRGKALLGIPLDLYDWFVRVGMGGLAANFLFDWKIPPLYLKIFIVVIPITYFLIAWIDKRYLKIWRYENRYQLKNREINPYFEEKFEETNNKIKQNVEVLQELVKVIKAKQ